MKLFAIQIIELALALIKDNEGTGAAAVLVRIVGQTLQAYRDHTGQPLDLSLIKPEKPV